MKTKKRSIENYTALAVALLTQTTSDAQVEIKDFDPDLRMMNWREDGLTNDTIKIDVDENGIDDLMFVYDYEFPGFSGKFHVSAQCFDAVTAFGTDTWPISLGVGDTIDSDLNWIDTYFYMQSIDINFFFSTTTFSTSYRIEIDDFIAIKLNLDGNTHYGWVRLSCNGIADEDMSYFTDYFYDTESPVTIFEVGINNTPNAPIVCDANVLAEEATIDKMKLLDDIDANDITDLLLSFHVNSEPDFSELRFFLVPSRDDIIHFSIEQALVLSEERYLSISPDSLIIGEDNKIRLPLSLLDINGDTFSPDNYYSGFYLKIPLISDTVNISLSSPIAVMKPQLQRCELEVNSAEAYLTEENALYVSFTNDINEEDIGEYGVSVIQEKDVWDWSYYGDDPENFILDWVIHFPLNAEGVYDSLITGFEKDIYGEDIIYGNYYYPVIIGFGDGYNRDLFCYQLIYNQVEFNTTIINNDQENEIRIYQQNTLGVQIEYMNIIEKHALLEIRNLAGQLLNTEITSSPHQTFSFPSLPNGIYIATVKENDIPVVISKIILNR